MIIWTIINIIALGNSESLVSVLYDTIDTPSKIISSSVSDQFKQDRVSLLRVPEVCDQQYGVDRMMRMNSPQEIRRVLNSDKFSKEYIVKDSECTEYFSFSSIDGSCNGYNKNNAAIRTPMQRLFGTSSVWFSKNNEARVGPNPRTLSLILTAFNHSDRPIYYKDSVSNAARQRRILKFFDAKFDNCILSGEIIENDISQLIYDQNSSYRLLMEANVQVETPIETSETSTELPTGQTNSVNLQSNGGNSGAIENSDGTTNTEVSPSSQQTTNDTQNINNEQKQSEGPRELSTYAMQWGQFLDHDMTLLRDQGKCECNLKTTYCRNISIKNLKHNGINIVEPYLQHDCIPFTRSEKIETIINGNKIVTPVNSITSYLDASQIYGSTYQRSTYLRTNQGTMKTTQLNGEEYLPLEFIETDIDCTGSHYCFCFAAGDRRSTEQTGLTATHTGWVRIHNKIARKIQSIKPELDGNTIYFHTRYIVTALYNRITYNEYLPLILGNTIFQSLIGEYKGYVKDADPRIMVEFASAAFRFGHSMIPNMLFHAIPKNHRTVNPENIAENLNKIVHEATGVTLVPLLLRSAFKNPDGLIIYGASSIILGLLYGTSNPVNTAFSLEITNHLFQPLSQIAPLQKPQIIPQKQFRPPTSVDLGADLISINIARGRDNGLRSYGIYKEAARRYFSKAAIPQYESKIPSSLESVLEAVYQGNLYRAGDLFVGGLAESPVQGGLLGSTFAFLVGLQFKLLRDGDAHWYERDDNNYIKSLVKDFRLSTYICLSIGDNFIDLSVPVDAFHQLTNSTPLISCNRIVSEFDTLLDSYIASI